MSDTSKVVTFLLAIGLYLLWRNTHKSLATGGASSAGNSIANTSTLAGSSSTSAGNRRTTFKNTWGDQQ